MYVDFLRVLIPKRNRRGGGCWPCVRVSALNGALYTSGAKMDNRKPPRAVNVFSESFQSSSPTTMTSLPCLAKDHQNYSKIFPVRPSVRPVLPSVSNSLAETR